MTIIETTKELTPETRAVYEANKHTAYEFGLTSNCHLGFNEPFLEWMHGIKRDFPLSERLRLTNALYDAYILGEQSRRDTRYELA